EEAARGRLDGPLPLPRFERIDEGYLDPEPTELALEELVGGAVDPLARDQVVAGTQHREVCERRGAHAAREEDRGLRSLEERQALGDGDLVGVVAVAGVEHFLRGADGFPAGAALV